ncbi:MAG: DNA-formamidopyrimidine glycosylase family protein, partial [Ilumatobacter sp.]|nr:DNA-formamidopyrimidine glycosylase family protein [Ilumatobacter sp.]
MPELPEVETVRRGLDRHVVGQRIVSVEVGRERVVRRTSRVELIGGLTDTVVLAAERRGKYLLLPLDSGNVL